MTVGCSQNHKVTKQTPELAKAEEVMFDHPDSALHILESMPIPSARKDKENHALWCLLTSQAKVKLIMKIPSDSLVKIAYDYYKSTDNARRKAMSALYMGDINYELGKIEEAMQYYLEGKTEVEKTEDYKTGYLIMSSLGKLYLYRRLNAYALEACTIAYDYAVKDSNKRYQMGALQYLARCYCILNELPKAIETYQKCGDIAVELGLNNKAYYYDIQTEIALVYKNSSQFLQSLEILKSFPVKFQSSSLIGKNYFYLKQYDSAYFYLNKALLTDNIYTKASVYEFLYKFGNQPKYRKYLTSYCDSLLFYNDSIITLDKGKEIIAYKEKYDNERLTTEKQRLELEKSNITYWWMFTIVIVLLLGILLIYIYLHKRIAIHQKEEKLTRLALQLHDKELEVEKNESYIAELQSQFEQNNKKEELYVEQVEALKKLKKENERLSLEKNMLHEKIASYSISGRELSDVKTLSDRVLLLEKREKELCSLLLTQAPFLRKLHLQPVYLNETELKDVCKIADNIFQKFTQRLSKEVSVLSEHEIILCSLIKLRFSITEISIFLNIAPASVSRSKLRIKNKICSVLGENLKEKSLDVWLWEY
jgi:tetratricopeptide (TPR) repeat protein